jgi:hypothetical protein
MSSDAILKPVQPGTMAWKTQFIAYLAIALAILVLTAIQLTSSRTYFARYYGSLEPVLVAVAAGVIGAGALALLRRISGFQIVTGRTTVLGITVSTGIATPLGVEIAVGDLIVRYPETLNVQVPQAFLFYPTIGFVAEIVFHLVPLALLVLILSPLGARIGMERVVWIAILFTAASEPTFQILFGGEKLTWASAYTWVHVGAIAFFQLLVFRRYDFVGMYAFRLVYYAWWHIIWGVIRLEVLF